MLIHSPLELAMVVSNRRKDAKMSQSAAADLVGLRQTTISAFENKPGSTELDTLFRILAALNLDIHILAKVESTSPDKSKWDKEW